MSGYSVSARIIRRGIQVTKNSKAVSSKDYQTTTSVTGYLVITRPTRMNVRITTASSYP